MEFEELLKLYETWPEDRQFTDEEQKNFIYKAGQASKFGALEFNRMAAILKRHGNGEIDGRKIASICTKAKISSNLGGQYPHDGIEQFVELFLFAHNLKYTFAGSYKEGSHERSSSYVLNLMSNFFADVHKLYTMHEVTAALSNWEVKRQSAIIKNNYQKVRYNPNADKTELDRFVLYLLFDKTPVETKEQEELFICTKTVLENFIWRTKNHLRSNWQHSAHCMPVFYGAQGTGKTEICKKLFEPLDDLTSWVDFSILSDNSKNYQLSTVPIFYFDEMSGINKADTNKLKTVMTAKDMQLRQMYEKATGKKTLVTTFIGSTNKSISQTIRDESGARRIFEIPVPFLDRKKIAEFDALAMWQGVDENIPTPPLYADKDITDIILSAQRENSFKGVVQEWIEAGVKYPSEYKKFRDLFADYFRDWGERNYPNQMNQMDATKFKSELESLRVNSTYKHRRRIEYKKTNNYHWYKILPAAEEQVDSQKIMKNETNDKIIDILSKKGSQNV